MVVSIVVLRFCLWVLGLCAVVVCCGCGCVLCCGCGCDCVFVARLWLRVCDYVFVDVFAVVLVAVSL